MPHVGSADEETARFRIRRQVDGEVTVTTWLFPAKLRAANAPDEYMASLAEDMGANKRDVLETLTADALRRAKTASPGVCPAPSRRAHAGRTRA